VRNLVGKVWTTTTPEAVIRASASATERTPSEILVKTIRGSAEPRLLPQSISPLNSAGVHRRCWTAGFLRALWKSVRLCMVDLRALTALSDGKIYR